MGPPGGTDRQQNVGGVALGRASALRQADARAGQPHRLRRRHGVRHHRTACRQGNARPSPDGMDPRQWNIRRELGAGRRRDPTGASRPAARGDGVDAADISVITPFKAVQENLKRLLGETMVSGTIHTMQGKEAPVVIMVLGGQYRRFRRTRLGGLGAQPAERGGNTGQAALLRNRRPERLAAPRSVLRCHGSVAAPAPSRM